MYAMFEDKWKCPKWRLAEGAEAARGAGHGVVIARDHAGRRSRASGESRVAAEHGDTGAVLGAAERDHVFANVAADDVAMLAAAVGEDELYKIVSELVAGDCRCVS
jgi:hypothetical protein